VSTIFLVLIKLYWRAYPEDKRRVCLYRETCSHHSQRVLIEKGLFKGLEAFADRMSGCKGGYSFKAKEGRISIATVNSNIIQEEDINPFVLAGLKAWLSY
jgi:uncharacterized protein